MRGIYLNAEHRPAHDPASDRGAPGYANPSLSLRELPALALPATAIRVRMLCAGICGTELHAVQADPVSRRILTTAPLSIPAEGRLIGHEGVGEVIETGSHAGPVQAGDVVAFESLLSCGDCEPCRRGAPNQCRNASLLGLQCDGLFADQAILPARLARKIDLDPASSRDLCAAACLEPAAVALLACRNSSLAPGDAVIVFGAGPIGLLIAMIARSLFGAGRITIVEPSAFRRNFAARWCDDAISPDAVASVAGPFDCAFETSGELSNVDHFVDRIGASGRICLLARSGMPLQIRDVDHLITNNIRVVGTRGHLGGLFERLWRAQRAGLVDLGAVVTRRVHGLAELLRVLQTPQDVVRGDCKVVCELGSRS